MDTSDRRDLFAAHALQGLLAADRAPGKAREEVCERAADWAETMLTVLNRRRRERDQATGPLSRPPPPMGMKGV